MSTPIPNNGKDFFSLPAEVRMGVYDELIAANDRAIFSTCSFVRKDGLSRTFRFILGTYDYVPYNLPPGSKATDQAQDVDFIIEIRINEHLASRGYVADPLDLSIIEYFGGSDIARESCSICLELASNEFFWNMPTDPALFRALGCLTGFKKLTLRLNLQENGEPFTCHPRNGYEHVQRVLESTLGPATYHDGDWWDRCLEFRPLEFVQRAWYCEGELRSGLGDRCK